MPTSSGHKLASEDEDNYENDWKIDLYPLQTVLLVMHT